jgi:hypothetical protein
MILLIKNLNIWRKKIHENVLKQGRIFPSHDSLDVVVFKADIAIGEKREIIIRPASLYRISLICVETALFRFTAGYTVRNEFISRYQ